MSRAGCIMVQGTMSGAGKSLLCAALCRIFAQDGYKTAPFKSQNMALNSFVTRDGLEMGRAQVVQAQAAGVEPDVRMNPILLKPSSDVGSQVIVNGEVRGDMPAKEYFRRKKSLIPDILRAYDSLADEFDIIVIEGAGSPAEINLKADDIVNMGLAKLVDAPVLLAGDIDRGGVFAQLYGTVALLEPDERARICGLIINKFRGDVEILRPGLAMLEEKTQLPVLGVVPYLRVDIEDEDSLAPRLQQQKRGQAAGRSCFEIAAYFQFYRFYAAGTAPAFGCAVRAVRAGAGRAGPGHSARHQKHGERPVVAAPVRAGGRCAQAGSRRHAGAGRLRRLPAAGRDARRQSGHRERPSADAARAGPAADADGLYRRKAPRTGHGARLPRPLPGLR